MGAGGVDEPRRLDGKLFEVKCGFSIQEIQEDFYRQILGLPVIGETPTRRQRSASLRHAESCVVDAVRREHGREVIAVAHYEGEKIVVDFAEPSLR